MFIGTGADEHFMNKKTSELKKGLLVKIKYTFYEELVASIMGYFVPAYWTSKKVKNR